MIAAVGTGLRRAGDLGRDLLASVWRDFLVDEFQEGRIRTRGLPAGVRVGLAAAVVVTCALFVSAASADAWRQLDLQVLSGQQVLRGTLLPAPLIPVTFGVLALATALCVAGALRSGPLVTVAVGFLFAFEAAFVHGLTAGADDLLHRGAGLAIVVVVAMLVLVRHLRPRPGLELAACIALVGLVFADAHRLNAATDRASGTDFLASQADVLLFDIAFLSTPLVMVAALEVIAFGVLAARWGVGFVDDRLGGRTLVVAVVALFAWRARDLIVEVRSGAAELGWATELQPLVGSLALLAMVGGAAVAIRWISGREPAGENPLTITEDGTRAAIPVAVALTSVLTLVGVLFLMTKVGFAYLSVDAAATLERGLSQAIDLATRTMRSIWWELITVLAAAGAAVVLARRGSTSLAVFLAAVGAVLLHEMVMPTDGALSTWAWTLGGIDLLIVAALGAFLVRWWRAGQLTARRWRWSLYLLLLTGLFRQEQFLSDPFEPLLAFNQSAFVLFGLVWGFATGLSWANGSSRLLPRLSRAQLMIGYQLLSIAILHWYLVSHEMSMLDWLTRLQPGVGEAVLGQPLVLVLIVTAAASLLADVDLPTDEEDDDLADGSTDDRPTLDPRPI